MFFRALLCLVSFVWTSTSFAQCDPAPVAVNDVVHASAVAVVVVDVLANDYDPGGEPLDVSVVSNTCNGTTEVDRGLVIFTPSTQVTQSCTITYSAKDEAMQIAQAVITVLPVGAPPPPPPPPRNLIFGDGFETGDLSRWTTSQGFGR